MTAAAARSGKSRALLQPLAWRHRSQHHSSRRATPASRPSAPTAKLDTMLASRSKAQTPADGSGTDTAQGRAALRLAAAREATLHSARMSRFTELQIREMEAVEKQRQREDYQRRYNKAARWWLKIMVGLPVLVVSSWHLFDRLALGNHPPDLPWPPPPPGMPPHKKGEE
ncbi:hypothetical protein XA68_13169 [Ophiocordyceps unilateralis]|uniref:Uncharacterized protein n=1 Tax=Ophiocordyceps unilateralis TaxID=268505 RepID=A0A2A9PD37_OPHUN|nr:hypothetical protein XA68_13169 [Ophiocordyceps unilateralis]